MIKLYNDIVQNVVYPPGGTPVDRVIFNGTRVYEKTPSPYGINSVNPGGVLVSGVQKHSFGYNIDVENDFILSKQELYVNEGTGDGTGGDLIGTAYNYAQGYNLGGASTWNFYAEADPVLVLPSYGTAYVYFTVKSTSHSGEVSWSSSPIGAYTAFMGKPVIATATREYGNTWTRITWANPANHLSTYVDYSTDGTNWYGLWIRGYPSTDAWHSNSTPIYYRIRFQDNANYFSLYSDPVYLP